MIAPILVAFIVILFVWFLAQRGTYPGVPVINTLPLRFLGKNIHRTISETSNKRGSEFVYVRPFSVSLLATDADLAKKILQGDGISFRKSAKKRPQALPFSEFSNLSVVNVNGEVWKDQRNAMGGAFHHDFLKNLVPLLCQKVERMFECWSPSLAVNSELDVVPWMRNLTVDIIGEAALAQEFDLLGGKENTFTSKYDILMNNMSLVLIALPFLGKLPLPRNKMIHGVQSDTREWLQDAVAKRRAQHKNECLIDMMINSAMSDEEILNNVFVFFLAGHETTASTLSWALYFLAKYPDMQTRMRNEIAEQLSGSQGVSHDLLKKLSYMDMFLKEVMRFYPTAPQIAPRTTTEPVQLGLLNLPVGSQLSISIFSIHHNPKYWPEPEAFKPERFSPENSVGRHPYTYLPFSLGKRHCIGMNFSNLEQRICLAMLLQKYKVDFVEEPTIDNNNVLLMAPGRVRVHIEPL